jgi:glutamine amidotransferase
MCRLFAQISPTPAGASRFLVDSEFSLLNQSNFVKSNLQKDGWGIAHFGNDGKPVVSKSPRPAFEEPAEFRAAARARSRVVLGHIRAASNPRGIARGRLINLENTQPFTDGRWVFAHNGTLEIPDEVARRLGPLRRHLRSLNDSEVYFWQFIKHLERTGEPAAALRECIREDWDLWRKCRQHYPEKKTPYTSLNALVSDGRRLYAVCHAVRRGRADCAVCTPSQPWSVMSFARRGEKLLIGSENLDRGSWTRLVQPEILSVSLSAGGLKVKRERLEVPADPHKIACEELSR